MQYTGERGSGKYRNPFFCFPFSRHCQLFSGRGSIETMRGSQSSSVSADSASFRFSAVDRIIWQNNPVGDMFHGADNGPPVPLLLSSKRRESFSVLLRQYMQANKSRKHIRRQICTEIPRRHRIFSPHRAGKRCRIISLHNDLPTLPKPCSPQYISSFQDGPDKAAFLQGRSAYFSHDRAS